MATRVRHIARISVQDWRTSRVRARSAVTGDPLLRTIYFEIILALYEHGGSLPSDPEILADLLMLPADEIESRLPILAKLGEKGRGGIILHRDGTLTNLRVTEDLDEERAYRDQQSEHGKRGGRPGKDRSKPSIPAGHPAARATERVEKGRVSEPSPKGRREPEDTPQRSRGASSETTDSKEEKRVPLGSGKGTSSPPTPKPLPLPLPLPLPEASSSSDSCVPTPTPSSGGGSSRARCEPMIPPPGGDGSLAAAARRWYVDYIDSNWRRARRGEPAPPLTPGDKALLESYAAEGVPVEVIVERLEELESRQRAKGKPIGAFPYFSTTGALEEHVTAWREGTLETEEDEASLDWYRDWRLAQLQDYLEGREAMLFGGKPKNTLVERARTELTQATTWPQMRSILQTIVTAVNKR